MLLDACPKVSRDGTFEERRSATDINMPRVLEETTSRELDRDHIVRRVDDWASRIDALYRALSGWLPIGWTAERKGTVSMREELMQKFHVPARELPVLQLFLDGKPSATIEPRGLWIIGANGRLDFFRGSCHCVIIDSAENFEPADWHIAPLSDRQNLRRLNRDSFNASL
jgi:hypothetical protein